VIRTNTNLAKIEESVNVASKQYPVFDMVRVLPFVRVDVIVYSRL